MISNKKKIKKIKSRKKIMNNWCEENRAFKEYLTGVI